MSLKPGFLLVAPIQRTDDRAASRLMVAVDSWSVAACTALAVAADCNLGVGERTAAADMAVAAAEDGTGLAAEHIRLPEAAR
eukprot:m.42093 g.42093  ORF g.42093 m.42093 type:complete len:82 (-) comp12856_c0_seq2:446-691(-)